MKNNNLTDFYNALQSIAQVNEIDKRKGMDTASLKKLLWLKGVKLVIVFLFFLTSCDNDKPVEQTDSNKPVVKKYVPEFNADSAFAFVKKQVEFGPRIPNSKAHSDCEKYFVATLKKYGLKVIEQKGTVKGYDGKMLPFNNITAQYQPENPRRIMISSHWDSRPWADNDNHDTDKPIDAANDGASGVGIILELARILQTHKIDVGVDFVLFDVEDYGKPDFENSYCLGSQYWSRNLPIKIKPEFGVNLDMVGDPNAKFTYEGISTMNARFAVNKVWQSAATLGYSKYFSFEETDPITDDHKYVNELAKIPCIDVIDKSTSSFSATWHTHKDNIKNISPFTLKAVGQTLLFVLTYE